MKMLVAVLLSVCVIMVAGCGKRSGERIAEKMAEAAMAKDGVKGKVNISGDKVTIETKDGKSTFASGGNAKVPENFPKDVPVYAGASILASASVPNGSVLTLQTKDAAAKVMSFYKGKLTGSGWTSEMTMEQGEQLMSAYKKGKKTISIIAGKSDKLTSITITASDE